MPYDDVKFIKSFQRPDGKTNRDAPVFKEKSLGRVEVRQTFRVPKLGMVAGSYVVDGTIQRGGMVRLLRDGKVVFEGEKLSLSAAALKALHHLGYKTPAASVSEHWMFDGELLDERRRRLEAEQFDQSGVSGPE